MYQNNFPRLLLLTAYFLEDIVQELNFDPPPDTRKRKKNKKDDEDDSETAVEGDENMNKVVSNEYSDLTKSRVAALSEKDISFELIEVWFVLDWLDRRVS